MKLLKYNVISLVVDSPGMVTHEALSSMLRIPLVTTRIGSSPFNIAKQSKYHIQMAPRSHDITDAIKGIIAHYQWKNLLVFNDGELSSHLPELVRGLVTLVSGSGWFMKMPLIIRKARIAHLNHNSLISA